jgi:hypothetical protein
MALAALVASGCSVFSSTQPSPAPVYVLEIAGLVASIDTVGPGTRYELGDGRVVSTEGGVRMPGSSDPDIGDLLLSGTEPARWLHGLRALDPKPVPEPSACYVIVGETRTMSTHVLVSVHDALLGDGFIAFKKAPEWVDDAVVTVDGSNVLMGVFNCVNERGEMTEHRFGQ